MVSRVPRQDLEALVVVALATAPALIKSKLKSKLPHVADEARDALARAICDKIDNDAYMVIVTEMIALAPPPPRRAPGGAHEPVPAVVPVPPPPPGAGAE
jgi:hypothetical protein